MDLLNFFPSNIGICTFAIHRPFTEDVKRWIPVDVYTGGKERSQLPWFPSFPPSSPPTLPFIHLFLHPPSPSFSSSSFLPFPPPSPPPRLPPSLFLPPFPSCPSAVHHLLYARFVTHFLYDIGLVSVREPFQKVLTQVTKIYESVSRRS